MKTAKIKYYFESLDDEYCYTLEKFKNIMREDNLASMVLYEAIKEKCDEGVFFCKYYGEWGETGDCGKQCKEYKPCNGKNGRCKFYSKDNYFTGNKTTITL